MGSIWFQRLKSDCGKISSDIRFVRIKNGYYRIFWRNKYIHEAYKEMPQIGYDFEEEDPRFEFKSYYEEFEDIADVTRMVKNFVEGYWDSINRIKRRVYLLRNDEEYNERARNVYSNSNFK